MAGAGAKTERSLPPPPGVPALRSPSLSQAESARTVPVGPSKRLLLLQRVGGLEAPLGITGAGPRAESSAGLRRRRAPGVETEGWWKARLPCSAAGALHPGAPLRGHVRRLTLLSSAVRSLSSQGSPHPVPGAGGQQDEGLGLSKARVPCLRAEVLCKSPSDPGRGAYAGWGPRWASRLRLSGCALGARNGRGRGQLWGVRAPLSWLAGGLCVGRSEGLGSPLCVCLSPRARRSSNKFCISAINFSHYICTNQRSPSSGPGAGLALKVVLGADC